MFYQFIKSIATIALIGMATQVQTMTIEGPTREPSRATESPTVEALNDIRSTQSFSEVKGRGPNLENIFTECLCIQKNVINHCVKSSVATIKKIASAAFCYYILLRGW